MMTLEMPSPTKKKPAVKARKPPQAPPKPRAKALPESGRKKSLFTRAGDEAKAAAQRALLLKTLKAHDWNLTAAAEALEMAALANIIRALQELAPEEYEAARADGRISSGKRRE